MSCQGKPKPIMFVKKEDDHTVIGNFIKKKHPALSRWIGKPEATNIFYPIDDFKALINTVASQNGATAIKMYYASWSLTKDTAVNSIVQAGYKDLLTLVFVGMDQNQMDIPVYFIVSPFGGILTIAKETASALVLGFQTDKVNLIQEIMYAAGRPDFVESLSLWYELVKFNGPNGFIAEMDCQGAVGLSAYFGSYDEFFTAPASDGSTVKLGWAMTLIWELVKTITYKGVQLPYVFDLEDTGGWGSRPDPKPLVNPSSLRSEMFRPAPPARATIDGGNTGNPCPPATGCNPTLP